MPAQHMIDIDNAIKALIFAVLLGLGGTVTAFFAGAKWYLPNQFKRRDEQRKLENAAAAVDIERERMLPQMVENNQRLVNAMIETSQASNSAIMQRIQQDITSAAVLDANTRQLTANTDQLQESTEKLEAVERKVDRLHNRLTTIFPSDKSIDELFGELKQVVATTKQVVDERKHDSKPFHIIDAPKDNPQDSNGLEKAS